MGRPDGAGYKQSVTGSITTSLSVISMLGLTGLPIKPISNAAACAGTTPTWPLPSAVAWAFPPATPLAISVT